MSNLGCLSGGRKSNEDALKERRRVSALFSMMEPSLLQFYVSRQWLNKFKTFAEPGPISNSDFLCSHGGAYDSFHSEHHGAGSPVSFPSFLPCAACLQTPLFMAAVELPTVSYTVQGQTSKGGGVYSSLCRRSSSPLVVEKGEEFEIRPCQSSSFVFSLSWQRTLEMMDLEITQENTESLSEVLLCSFANEVAAELLSHPAKEHCQ